MQISTKSPKTGREITVDYDFGGTAKEAIEKFGEEAVYSAFEDASIVKLQAMIRGNLENAKNPVSDEQIMDKVAQWKPGVSLRKPGKSLVEQVADRYKAAKPEDRQRMLAELKAKLEAVSAE